MPVSKSTVILYSSYFIKGPMFIGPCSSYNRLSRYYRCYIIIIIISIIVQYYFSSVVFEFVHIFTFNSNTRFSVVGIPDSYSNLLQHQRRVCELRVHAAPKTGDWIMLFVCIIIINWMQSATEKLVLGRFERRDT